MSWFGRGAVVLIGFALGTASVPGVVAPANADPIGNCTTATGTIVAVDFAHFGGPVARGCGVAQPNGYALLHAAGFSTTGDNHDGPAFICRLGNRAFAGGAQYPTPAQDACVLTPPTTAYWSYWTAAPGQHSWSYSTSGATGDTPRAGGVELWTFGSTDTGGTRGSGRPTFSPDAVRAHNVVPSGDTATPTTAPAPTPTTVPAPKPAAPDPTRVGPGAGPEVSSVTTGPGPSAATKTTVGPTVSTTAAHSATTSTTTVGATGGRSGSTGPKFVDALPAVSRHTSSGSVVPLLIGIGFVLVLVLGAGAAVTIRRRRAVE